jgi:hypothetical protein
LSWAGACAQGLDKGGDPDDRVRLGLHLAKANVTTVGGLAATSKAFLEEVAATRLELTRVDLTESNALLDQVVPEPRV